MGDKRLSDAVTHEYFMKKALDLAVKGIGRVNPNPMVGALVVNNGHIVASGYHRRRGGHHAEREALASVDQGGVIGGTMYVTLEPCCHEGLTPPCTSAIIESGIARVVIGTLDPNPLVSGRGAAQLKSHGIDVVQGVLQAECKGINEVFNHFITRRTPYVVMKYAMTADGKIATRTGDSRWITSVESRRRAHKLRGTLTGIMVGIGTVLADDPLLTCRSGEGRNPVRVICDSRLRLPLVSRVVQTAATYPTIVATISEDNVRKQALQEYGVKVLATQSRDGKIDLEDLMCQLAAQDVDGVLLEGGAQLNYSALAQGIVHRIVVYVGPKIFGGVDGIPPIAGTGVAEVDRAFPVSLEQVNIIDNDVVLDYRIGEKSCSQE